MVFVVVVVIVAGIVMGGVVVLLAAGVGIAAAVPAQGLQQGRGLGAVIMFARAQK